MVDFSNGLLLCCLNCTLVSPVEKDVPLWGQNNALGSQEMPREGPPKTLAWTCDLKVSHCLLRGPSHPGASRWASLSFSLQSLQLKVNCLNCRILRATLRLCSAFLPFHFDQLTEALMTICLGDTTRNSWCRVLCCCGF